MSDLTPAFVAIYAGASISDARVLAASADPHLVQYVARQVLNLETEHSSHPAHEALERGRRAALRLVAGGKEGE